LTIAERRRLKQIAFSHTAPYQLVVRVRIVLDAAHGYSSNAIARRRGVHVDTVRLWRGRYDSERGVASLTDRQRSGRPPRITSLQRAQITALACQLPAETGVPLSRWSSGELARETVARGLAAAISASTVRRILAQNALKPWQHQSWIFIRDPDFAAKAARVLDLYARRWDDRPLAGDEYVISADEKTSIQARCRCHPTLPSGTSRMMRVNHDYDRGGALAYLAAYDVHHARVMGRTSAKTGIVPFMDLVEQVMTQEPYASATRVSGSSTTAPPTAARPPPTGSPRSFPTRSWCTPPCTPPGSTRWRSTSPSCSARWSHPTTSPALTRSKTG
jgi:transposase